jgi:phosphoglycerate dehydrogenase-like enzyme
MMLAITRGLMHLDNRTRKGEWDKELARGNSKQIYRKTVGIIGLGAIGRQVAKLLRAFDTDIVYCDPIPAPASLEKKLKLQRVSLNNLLTISDIVTLHLPKNKKTSLLIDKDKISQMKKDAILINCARGGLVDEFALSQALRNGRLFGAGIDTFSTEPPENNPLISLENVILTPHCAGATLDNFSFIAERAIENCSSFISNTALPELDVVHDPRNIDF